mgnify:CR=1 FL=1
MPPKSAEPPAFVLRYQSAIRSAPVSAYAKLLAFVLSSYANANGRSVFPSQRTLARDAGDATQVGCDYKTLADDFIMHKFDLRRLIRVIAATRAFGLDSKVPEGRAPLSVKHDQHRAAFALSRLRPEQVAGSILQAASLTAIDADSHIIFQLGRTIQQGDFIKRYGDVGADEFNSQGGTTTQRLLLMNGEMVLKRTEDNLVANAATRILATAHDDAAAVEAAYLAVLSRRPSLEESEYFVSALSRNDERGRKSKMEDLCWALINSTEFSWNH